MKNYRQQLIDYLADSCDIPVAVLNKALEVPPQSELGDFAFPCFVLAKELRRSPMEIAQNLQQLVNERLPDWLHSVENKGPYLNFFLDRAAVADSTLREILDSKADYGNSEMGADQTVLVEYSSPNIAKPFHVGHAFSTVLGQVIGNFYQALGYKVIRLNHLGDYGTQFGKLIAAWQHWGDEEALKADPITELTRCYVKFHEEAKAHPELEDEGRENFRLLENKDPEAVRLWQHFRDVSLEEFQRIYDRMGITFDNYNGESFYSDKIPAVIDRLRDLGLLEESEGAQVVNLEEFDLNPCLILKSDGTTIYASRDLAAVYYRDQEWNFFRNIYVVGLPQTNHFKQIFAVLKKAGFPKADNCVHVAFGTVKFADGEFSTRSGNVIKLEDLINRSVEKTANIIRTNNPDFSEEEISEIAESVGLAAVNFTYLHNGRERDIYFDWDEVLDFEGDTAPYLLYTLVRGKSILRKAEWQEKGEIELSKLVADDEYALVKYLAQYPDILKQAAERYEPGHLLRLLLNIARSFNRFYHNQSILNTEDVELRQARLTLTAAMCQVLENGLKLCAIPTVERM